MFGKKKTKKVKRYNTKTGRTEMVEVPVDSSWGSSDYSDYGSGGSDSGSSSSGSDSSSGGSCD